MPRVLGYERIARKGAPTRRIVGQAEAKGERALGSTDQIDDLRLCVDSQAWNGARQFCGGPDLASMHCSAATIRSADAAGADWDIKTQAGSAAVADLASTDQHQIKAAAALSFFFFLSHFFLFFWGSRGRLAFLAEADQSAWDAHCWHPRRKAKICFLF